MEAPSDEVVHAHRHREHQHSTHRREAACGIEEARLFIETALKRYEKKRKPILLPAVMTLTMGLRACEILKRQVRDLDDGCGILWIDQGKTHNARRHLRIPEFLRPLLQELIKGKGRSLSCSHRNCQGSRFDGRDCGQSFRTFVRRRE